MKRRRSAPKSRPTKRARTVAVVPANVMFPGPGRRQQFFTPRSFGNPRAVTERKYFDSIKTTANIVSAAGGSWNSSQLDPATLNTLFAPVTGDDFLNRDGRKVQVIAIKIKGLLQYANQATQTTADVVPVVRLALVQDTQTNGGQLDGDDVFGNAVTAPIFAFQNPAFFGRFKVLKDKTYSIPMPSTAQDAAGTFVQYGRDLPFKMSRKFRKPVTVHFNGTNGGTVADIIDNSFHMIGAMSENAGMVMQITYQCRVTFIDL